MATIPTQCPRCKNTWGLRELSPAKPKAGDVPAELARWKCEACYHHWELKD